MNKQIFLIFTLLSILSWTQAASLDVPLPTLPPTGFCLWPKVGGTAWIWNLTGNKETFTSDNQCIDLPTATIYRSAQAAYLEDSCKVFANSNCVGDPEYTATLTGYFRTYTNWPIKSFRCACRF